MTAEMLSKPSALPPLLVLVLAPLAGALVTASLAPFDWWPAGILSCALFAYLLAACSPGQAFWRGWLYGLGLFGTGVSWVYVSIHVHGPANIVLSDRAVLCGSGPCPGPIRLDLCAYCPPSAGGNVNWLPGAVGII